MGERAFFVDMEKKKRKKIDWDVVERKYRAGQLSIREIARQHKCSDGAVRKKAKAHGWTRDLITKVNQEVRNKLVRSEVRVPDEKTEKEIVEEAATVATDVVLSHRKGSQKGLWAVNILLKQLLEAAESRAQLEEEIAKETKGVPSRKERFMRAISLKTHSVIAVNLANALKTLVGVDRQSYNLDDGKYTADKTISEMSDEELQLIASGQLKQLRRG